MSELTETIIELDAWASAGLPELSEIAVGATLSQIGMQRSGYLVVVLGCDNQKISILNNDFRDKDKATNVLSWPSEDRKPDALPETGTLADPTELGDIAIAFETCEAEAAAQGKTLHDHATHLIVHATLHLLGYDHEEDNEAALMESTETAILASIGINDPYMLGPV